MRIGGIEKCSFIDYPGKMTAILFTVGCNFRCHYCHNPELVDATAETIPEAEVFAFLERRRNLLDAVTVTGGEPTVHSDLIPFLRRIKELGYLLKLDSNGTNPKMLKDIIDEKLVDYIAMDIKAPLPSYEKIIVRSVDTDALAKSIKLIMESGIEYEFRTTIEKSLTSLDDIRGIGETIRGAKKYYLQKFVPTKTLDLQFLEGSTYNDEEFETMKSIMEEYVGECMIRS